ncbi:hypothetical protein COSO111634_20875 [Corallococcus soli]
MASEGKRTRSPRDRAQRASSSGFSGAGSEAASQVVPGVGRRRASRPAKKPVSDAWLSAHAGWPAPRGSSHASESGAGGGDSPCGATGASPSSAASIWRTRAGSSRKDVTSPRQVTRWDACWPSTAYTARESRSVGPSATGAPPASSTPHSAASFSGDARRHSATGSPGDRPRSRSRVAIRRAREASAAHVQDASPWLTAMASGWSRACSRRSAGRDGAGGVARGSGQARRSCSVARGRRERDSSGRASAAPSSTWRCSSMRRAVDASNSSVAYSSAPCTRPGSSVRMSVRSDSVAPHCTGVPGTSMNVPRVPTAASASPPIDRFE